MTEMAQRSSDFVHELREAVTQNPLSATLIGMGLVWLFAPRPENSDTRRTNARHGRCGTAGLEGREFRPAVHL